jgi:TonB family protein
MSKPEEWGKWEGRVVDGKFPLRQWLGGSDHSAVFLTDRPGQTQKVAIKLIAADAGGDRQLARWRAAAPLSHPNLMRIFEAGRCQIDGEPLLYLLMEYAEEDLSQILPQRPLSPAEVTDLLPALLDALSYLHGKGVVHGRIKPSNVQAMGDELKLSADQIVSFAEPNSAGRRDVYDAPETASGIMSPAGDVWSIGVTLVAALTQNVTFVEAVEAATSQRDPGPQHAVPQPFRGIARECLHLDPKRRCSIAEIQARLQPEGRSVPAEPDAPPPPKRPVKRNLVFAIFLGMAMLSGFVVFHSRGKNAAAPAAAASEQPAPQAPPQAAPAPAANPPAQQPATVQQPALAPQPPKKAAPALAEVAHQVLPEVPQSARNTITGTIKVNVQVEVDSSGRVTAAKLTHPGPSEYFARLAVKAAQQWEFTPPAADGAPAASAWNIQFRYKRTSTQASAQPVKR